MLSVIPYHKSENLYQLEFLSHNTEGVACIICPNPTIADDFRAKLLSTSEKRSFEVITISKFINDLIKKYLSEVQFTRKSELLLILAGVWKAKFSHLPKETFFQAFEYFTDLRSYTFDKNLLSEVLSHLDDHIKHAIEVFWLISDSPDLEILDEHKAYHLLADFIREDQNPSLDQDERNYIFYGFNHLSGSQVDFVRSLSIRNDVYIPLPSSALSSSKKSDWINWLESRDDSLEDQEILQKNKIKIQVVKFQKNRLGESLKRYAEENSAAELDIYLAKKNPSYAELNEVPIKNVIFKSQSLLLNSMAKFVSNELSCVLEKKCLVVSEMDGLFKTLYQKFGKQNGKINYRLVKILQIYKKSFEEMRELSAIFEDIDKFTLSILDEVVLLNLPRIFNFPIAKGEMSIHLKGLESIESFDNKKETIIIAKSGYGKLKPAESVYSEEVMSVLASIGPVRRTEFEYQILKYQISEILSSKKIVLFLEEGLDDNNPSWSDLLSRFDMDEVTFGDDINKKNKIDPTLEIKKKLEGQKRDYLGTYSASKVQTFLDCKLKFYFKYISKIDLNVRPKNRIKPNDLGIMEHEIIESYISSRDRFNESDHLQVVKKIFYHFLGKHNVSLDFLEHRKYLIELINYSKEAILFLNKFREIDKNCKISFEVKLDKKQCDSFVGSVDCLVETNLGVFIFDFKRGTGGIPSFSEWVEFGKIQLWCYANFLNIDIKEVLCLGYLNLSEMSKSLLIPSSSQGHEEILNYDLGIKPVKKKFELLEKNKEFHKFYLETIELIKKEKDFYPNPKNHLVCQFCDISNVCHRGANGN